MGVTEGLGEGVGVSVGIGVGLTSGSGDELSVDVAFGTWLGTIESDGAGAFPHAQMTKIINKYLTNLLLHYAL